MSVTVASFRASFPEFTDPVRYPDAAVNFYLTLATRMLRPQVWGDLLDQGVMLFMAHNLVLAMRAAKAATVGSAPGVASGAVSSKTVDKVSMSYDTAGTAVQGGGQYNLTIYGNQYLQLVSIVGLGGTQL